MIPEPFTLERPAVDWPRHKRTDAPKILPPPGEVWRTPGGRKQAGRYYTRTTTLAKTLEDSYAIAQWRIRRALVGIGQRPDYAAAAAALTIDDHDRDALEELAGRCIEASGPSAALIGTMLHSFTERIDRGEPLGFVPEAYRELVEAWRRITAPLRLEYREVRTVHDRLGAAGTPDAFGFCSLPDPDGVVDERRVIDLKSGSIGHPATMSAQLFLYADSDLYDPETGERRPLEVNQRWGLIVHLKSDGSEPPGLYWLNLEHGRQCVELAVPVREWRAVKADAILRPALVEETVPATPAPDAGLVDITEALRVASERVDDPTDYPGEAWASVDTVPELEAVPGEPLPELPASAYAPDAVDLEPVDERCELSDLLVSECACRVHRPDVPDGALDDGDETVDVTEALGALDERATGDTMVERIAAAITTRDLDLLWQIEGERWHEGHRAQAAARYAELADRERLDRPRAALLAAIATASGLELRALWFEHGRGELWTEEHTAAATRRHAELTDAA